MQTEILARLPLKTISRFKSVCKAWKSTLESIYFRRLFMSLHRNSSSSSSPWSLLHGKDELIGFHGCKTWDLPKSPASLIPPSFKRYCNSGRLVLLADGSDHACCYVGSPVTQKWVIIPPPPSDIPTGDTNVFGLVSRLDEDGVVLSFKVIRRASVQSTDDYPSSVLLYSSETGIWTSKLVQFPHYITYMYYINLNGTIYFTCGGKPGAIVTHDFYYESDQFPVVQLPDYPDNNNKGYKRTLTISGGFVMYVRSLAGKVETFLKIWRLINNDDYSWQLLWEVGFPCIGNFAPMAMHPFDMGIVYLWGSPHWVSCNMRKRDYTILSNASNDGHQDCFIDHSFCKRRQLDEFWDPICTWLCPFVIPRWMEPVPRPPQAEIIDTTSLLSHATATRERMMRDNMRESE